LIVDSAAADWRIGPEGVMEMSPVFVSANGYTQQPPKVDASSSSRLCRYSACSFQSGFCHLRKACPSRCRDGRWWRRTVGPKQPLIRPAPGFESHDCADFHEIVAGLDQDNARIHSQASPCPTVRLYPSSPDTATSPLEISAIAIMPWVARPEMLAAGPQPIRIP